MGANGRELGYGELRVLGYGMCPRKYCSPCMNDPL